VDKVHWTFGYQKRMRIALNLLAISALLTELDEVSRKDYYEHDVCVFLLRTYVDALKKELIDDLHSQSEFPF